MNKLLENITKAYAQAKQERSILYKLENIKINEIKSKTTITYDLLGTGKSPFDKKLLDVYNSGMLYQFRPEDIKVISTTAALLVNDVVSKSLKSFDLNEDGYPTVTFLGKHTKQLYKYRLEEIEADPRILKKLGLDGYSGYLLANRVMISKK